MYPGYAHAASLIAMTNEIAQGQFFEAGLGHLSVKHIQIVPQNKGHLDDAQLDALMALMPNSSLRLHANAPVMEKHVFVDLVDFDKEPEYFAALKRANKRLGSPDYSLHSGKRTCTLRSLFDKALRLQDFLGARVAIEGQYKTPRAAAYIINSWKEYEKLLESGCFFALDLSHLNIVAHTEGRQDDLTLAMLQSPRCIEIHLSTNDGTGDQHQVVDSPDWWSALLPKANPQAVVFSEGNRRVKDRAKTRPYSSGENALALTLEQTHQKAQGAIQ